MSAGTAVAAAGAEGLPPGPKIGLFNIRSYVKDAPKFFEGCRAKYGDTFTLSLPLGKLVLTGSPEGVRQIYAAEASGLDVFAPEFFSPFLNETSLPVLGGARHQRQRKLLSPPFHGARMKAYGRVMQDITLERVRAWAPGSVVDLTELGHAVSLEVIIRTIFGVAEADRTARFVAAVTEYTRAMRPVLIFFPPSRRGFGGLGPWAKYLRAKAAIEALIDEQVGRYRRDRGRDADSVLRLLLDARDEDGQPMTDRQVRDEMLTLLFGGQETTAISMAWVFHRLGRHPAVLERLRAEVRALGELPEPSALASLPYLEAVCNEALRLYPVASNVARKLTRPLELCGHEVPAGAGVGACVSLVHTNARLYPEPHEFRPERFLEKKFGPHEFMPFGGGVRRCIGAAFASYEMKIVVGTVVARCELAGAGGPPIPQVQQSFVLGPRDAVRLRYDGPAS
ncbi:MAG TPA: cytochrome P450 [Polyangiaceae bacterium]|nr:cytochrome P450 [Polyangiaceae bacterium]